MELPFNMGALEPYISAVTMDFHYNRHYRGYVEKLKKLKDNTIYASLSLEQIVKMSATRKNYSDFDQNVFNNSSQSWNHEFFWQGLCAAHDQEPSSQLESKLVENFGSKSKFIAEFASLGLALFGSGWVWLVRREDGTLGLFSGSNADSPLARSLHPLLNCDVWEHAYYLDYKNERNIYLENFWRLVNWDFVEQQLDLPSNQ